MNIEFSNTDFNCSVDKKEIKLLKEKDLFNFLEKMIQKKLNNQFSSKVVERSKSNNPNKLNNDFKAINFNKPNNTQVPFKIRASEANNLKIKDMFKGTLQ